MQQHPTLPFPPRDQNAPYEPVIWTTEDWQVFREAQARMDDRDRDERGGDDESYADGRRPWRRDISALPAPFQRQRFFKHAAE